MFQMTASKVLSFVKKNKIAVLIPIATISYIGNDFYRTSIFKAKVAERDKNLKEAQTKQQS